MPFVIRDANRISRAFHANLSKQVADAAVDRRRSFRWVPRPGDVKNTEWCTHSGPSFTVLRPSDDDTTYTVRGTLLFFRWKSQMRIGLRQNTSQRMQTLTLRYVRRARQWNWCRISNCQDLFNTLVIWPAGVSICRRQFWSENCLTVCIMESHSERDSSKIARMWQSTAVVGHITAFQRWHYWSSIVPRLCLIFFNRLSFPKSQLNFRDKVK